MIADHDTNVVFVADTLEREFPAVYSGLRVDPRSHDIPLRTIPGTRSIWCRDYLPIQVAEGRFVQFRYEPDYLTGKYRHLRADGEIGPTLPGSGIARGRRSCWTGGMSSRGATGDRDGQDLPGEPRSIAGRCARTLEGELGLSELIVVPGSRTTRSAMRTGWSPGWMSGPCWSTTTHQLAWPSGVGCIGSRTSWNRVHRAPLRSPGRGRDGIPSGRRELDELLRAGCVLVVPTFGLAGDRRALDIIGRLAS